MWDEAGLERASTGELVGLACRALGVLAARSVVGLEPGASLELAESLGAGLDLGEAALAALLGVADRAGEASARRYPGTRGFLRTALGMRSGRAGERLTVTRQLPRLPRVAESLAAGKLSYGYASVICEAVVRLGEEDCAAAEEILLGMAEQGLSVTKVAKAGARILDLIAVRDGQEREPEDGRRSDRQWWQISKSLGGHGYARGRFSPVLLALIQERLGPLAKPTGPDDLRDTSERMADALEMYLSGGGSNWNATLVINLTEAHLPTAPPAEQPPAEEHPAGRPAAGECPRAEQPASEECPAEQACPEQAGPERPRGEQVRAEQVRPEQVRPEQVRPEQACPEQACPEQACPEQVRAEQACPEQACAEQVRAERPRAEQPASEERPTAQARPRGVPIRPDPAAGSGRRFPAWPLEDAGPGWRVTARLSDGTPVRPEVARTIAINAGISTLVLGPGHIPLYLGRRARFVTPGQRQALEALYQTCACDECDISARHCQLDHVMNWIDQGLTDIDLLAPACSHHNRLKYAHPDWFTLTRDQGRWRYAINRPGVRRHDLPGTTNKARAPA